MLKQLEQRNAHFDALVGERNLRWMGQNTNHFEPHEAVLDAIDQCIRSGEFHIYAPPLGLQELRRAIVEELGLADQCAIVSDGGIAALYHICLTLLKPGDELLTTDPTWNWPLSFARAAGASVKQVPIYGEQFRYTLSAESLRRGLSSRTKLVYVVDPNNPLGTVISRSHWDELVSRIRAVGAYLVHDCTYRDFALNHTVAGALYPERTITIYSFSKWLGLAGLRVGAFIGAPGLMGELAAAMPNNLGSSILAQRMAIAGLKIKSEWFPKVLKQQRENQEVIKHAIDRVTGLSVPVFPSNGNFLIIECEDAGIRPETLCAAYREIGILIRQGSYHTKQFGHKFVKVSTTVPRSWVDEFIRALPERMERAKGMNEVPELY